MGVGGMSLFISPLLKVVGVELEWATLLGSAWLLRPLNEPAIGASWVEQGEVQGVVGAVGVIHCDHSLLTAQLHRDCSPSRQLVISQHCNKLIVLPQYKY